MNLQVHHVLVWVSDMKRALDFYTRVLGLPLIYESPEFSQVGGDKFWISLHLSPRPVDERAKGEGPIINFRPDDVDKAYVELTRKGVKFYRTPYWAAPDVRVAEFWDTEGNRLSLSSAH